MTLITHPTADPQAPSALIPDEAALKLLFEQQFDPLCKRAAAGLGDAGGLAPRVVEQVFVRAWKDRGAFRTRDQLLAFLNEETDHGAVRLLSRRSAAHRMGAKNHDLHNDEKAHAVNGGTTDVATSWQHVVDALHTTTNGELRAQAIAQSQHVTAQHIAHAARKTNWLLVIGLFLAALLIVWGGGWLLNRSASKAILGKAVDSPDAEVVGTMATQVANASLADGTTLRIGADSRVKIPKIFNEEGRGVRAEGNIRFDVKPGSLPFEIFVGRAVVTVKGTMLSTRWLTDDSTAYVVLQQGEANVKSGDASRDLGVGTGVAITKDGAMRDATPGEIAEVTTWATDTVTVSNRPLKSALLEVRRWFGDAIVADSALLTRPVSFTAPIGQVRAAIAGIEASGKVAFGYREGAMVFTDSAAAAPAKKK